MKRVSWVNVALGLWLAVSPVVLHFRGPLRESDMATGVVAALVAMWALLVAPQRHIAAWVSLIVALWILISPWSLHVVGDGPTFASNALSGSVMAIFAIVRSVSAPAGSRVAA